MKPTKRIAIVDAGRTPDIVHAVLPFIEERYNLEITDDRDADYVFHSCLGHEVLKYSGIRIFVTGECVSPDFNISDYALAFDPIDFGDRYIRLPLIRLFTEAYESLCARAEPEQILAKKNGFCAYVMSNTKNSAPERVELFEALSRYQPVASGGKWRNNVGGPVADKIAFQSTHKFVLALENESYPGYLTEKFAQAAQSNAIPIYWGDPTITDIINPRAFVNVRDFQSTDALVSHIQSLDQDDAAYLSMLSEPWFRGGKEPEEWRAQGYRDFLANIFEQPKERAYRRNRSRWGKIRGALLRHGLQAAAPIRHLDQNCTQTPAALRSVSCAPADAYFSRSSDNVENIASVCGGSRACAGYAASDPH